MVQPLVSTIGNRHCYLQERIIKLSEAHFNRYGFFKIFIQSKISLLGSIHHIVRSMDVTLLTILDFTRVDL